MVYPVLTGSFVGSALGTLLAQLKGKNVVVVPIGANGQPIYNSSGEYNQQNNQYNQLNNNSVARCRLTGYVNCLAGADMLGSYLEPITTPSIFRIQIALDVAGVVSVVYKMGSNIAVYTINQGVALVANSLYVFDIMVHQDDQINLRSSLAGTANLRITEIKADS